MSDYRQGSGVWKTRRKLDMPITGLEPFEIDTRAKFLTRRARFDHVGQGPRGSPNQSIMSVGNYPIM